MNLRKELKANKSRLLIGAALAIKGYLFGAEGSYRDGNRLQRFLAFPCCNDDFFAIKKFREWLLPLKEDISLEELWTAVDLNYQLNLLFFC